MQKLTKRKTKCKIEFCSTNIFTNRTSDLDLTKDNGKLYNYCSNFSKEGSAYALHKEIQRFAESPLGVSTTVFVTSECLNPKSTTNTLYLVGLFHDSYLKVRTKTY